MKSAASTLHVVPPDCPGAKILEFLKMKARNCVSKTRNFVLKMLNFAAGHTMRHETPQVQSGGWAALAVIFGVQSGGWAALAVIFGVQSGGWAALAVIFGVDWGCDERGKTGDPHDNHWVCNECSHDLCEKCGKVRVGKAALAALNGAAAAAASPAAQTATADVSRRRLLTLRVPLSVHRTELARPMNRPVLHMSFSALSFTCSFEFLLNVVTLEDL